MSQNTIYQEIFSFHPGLFSPSELEERTGASKQLINYHLKTLTDKGLIVRQNRGVYYIADIAGMIQEVIKSAQTNNSEKKPKNTKTHGKITDLDVALNHLNFINKLGDPNAEQLIEAIEKDLDQTIANLILLRKRFKQGKFKKSNFVKIGQNDKFAERVLDNCMALYCTYLGYPEGGEKLKTKFNEINEDLFNPLRERYGDQES